MTGGDACEPGPLLVDTLAASGSIPRSRRRSWAHPRGGLRRSSSRGDRVERIGLAFAVAGVTVRPVDLDHLEVGGGEEPGEASPVGAGAFHPHPLECPEAAQPPVQQLIAGR